MDSTETIPAYIDANGKRHSIQVRNAAVPLDEQAKRLIGQLRAKLIAAYGQNGEYPDYPRDMWQESDGDYWDWVILIILNGLIKAVPGSLT